MKKLNSNQMQALDELREEIKLINLEVDQYYNKVLSFLGIEDNDWIFDYIHNCPNDDDNFTEFVRGKLYGGDQ